MKLNSFTAFLATTVLLAFLAVAYASPAQAQNPQYDSLQDLIGSSVTLTTNPYGRGPMILRGTLIGSTADGVMLQTAKTRTWIPNTSVLMIESS